MNNAYAWAIILILIFIYLMYIQQNDSNDPNEQIEQFNNTEKKYKIAVMGIFKNEESYMEEWIIHHIKQGVNHFYLYDNDGDKSKYKFLKNYDKFVTVTDWVDKEHNEWYTVQKQAYYDCISKYSSKCQFLMMLDIDEFLVPTENDLTVGKYIKNLSQEWDNIKAFKIQRYDFGSNDHITRPAGNVMDNYTAREQICSSYKTMANTDFIDKRLAYYVHDYNYVKNKKGKIYNPYLKYTVEFLGYPNKCRASSVNEIPIVINHYYTKSYEEFMARCDLWKSGGVNPEGGRKNCKKLFKKRDIKQQLIDDDRMMNI